MLLSYFYTLKRKNDFNKVSKDRVHAPRETVGGKKDGERMIELRSSCSTYRSRPRDEFFRDFIVNRSKGKKKKKGKTLRRR